MRLSGLLDASGGVFVSPLRHIYEATATAIEALGELDLIRYDDGPATESADLSLWEEMAPLLGATIAAVNALLADMDARFPSSHNPTDALHLRVHKLIQVASSELRTTASIAWLRSKLGS